MNDELIYYINENSFIIEMPEYYTIKTASMILDVDKILNKNNYINNIIFDFKKTEKLASYGNEIAILTEKVLSYKEYDIVIINISDKVKKVFELFSR